MLKEVARSVAPAYPPPRLPLAEGAPHVRWGWRGTNFRVPRPRGSAAVGTGFLVSQFSCFVLLSARGDKILVRAGPGALTLDTF